jgi:hypothetical protein
MTIEEMGIQHRDHRCATLTRFAETVPGSRMMRILIR